MRIWWRRFWKVVTEWTFGKQLKWPQLGHVNTVKTATCLFKQLLLFPMSNCSFLRKTPTILQKENLSLSLSHWVELPFPLPDQSRAHPFKWFPQKTIIFYLWLYYKWMHTTYLEGEKQPLSPHQCVLKRISKGRNHRSFHLFIISRLFPEVKYWFSQHTALGFMYLSAKYLKRKVLDGFP